MSGKPACRKSIGTWGLCVARRAGRASRGAGRSRHHPAAVLQARGAPPSLLSLLHTHPHNSITMSLTKDTVAALLAPLADVATAPAFFEQSCSPAVR